MSGSRHMPQDTHPWYKQFWPWFLIALPGSVVVAAFITLGIAIKHADEVVQDDYYKDGLAINQKIERDQVARARDIRATLHWEAASGNVRIELPAGVNDNVLTLHWMHPLKRQHDRIVRLTRQSDSGSYLGHVDDNVRGRFYLELENTSDDAATAWRLRGEIHIDDAASQAGITMTP